MELSEILVLAMFLTFIALLFTGYPVAWILGGVAVMYAGIGVYLVEYHDADLWIDWGSSIQVVPDRLWSLVANDTLVALPMFIFMGLMLDRSGIAENLMNNMVKLFGRIRGGYAVTVVIIGVLLAATTGIIGASVVLLGVLSIPVMMQNNYQKELAVGTACSVGTLGILIPPSIMLVLMADRLANPNASVGDLFLGAFFPGLLLGAMYIAFVLVWAFIKPNVAPAPKDAPPVDKTVVIGVFKAVGAPAGLILMVLGSIFFGVATTTEASGVGALGATWLYFYNSIYENSERSRKPLLILSAIGIAVFLAAQVFSPSDIDTKRVIAIGFLGSLAFTVPYLAWLSIKDHGGMGVLKESLQQTTKTTAFIFAIFIGATAFSVVLRGLGGDEVIEEALTGLPLSNTGILLVILLVTFILGFFLDWVEITLIILPLVAPVVEGMGYNLVWFTIMFAVCLQTSFLTPPVGFALFYIKGVCPPEINVGHIYRGVVPFILIQLTALAIVFLWEPIVTWLPSMKYASGG